MAEKGPDVHLVGKSIAQVPRKQHVGQQFHSCACKSLFQIRSISSFSAIFDIEIWRENM